METTTESTQLPTESESSQTPTPTPVSGEIKGGFSFSNPFGSTNTEDIKLKTQTDAGQLASEISALKTEIANKQAELKAKEYRLTQLNPKKGFFSGGKKSKKSHKKSHKKSSRKTR
jgi:hypothetical protein